MNIRATHSSCEYLSHSSWSIVWARAVVVLPKLVSSARTPPPNGLCRETKSQAAPMTCQGNILTPVVISGAAA